MAIDPRIALGVQPMQIENPVNQLAKVLQIKDMQQSGQLNALKMQEYQRGISETNALNEAYKGALGADGTVDRTRLFSSLAERNLGSKIPDIQKKFYDADKAKFDTQKSAFDGYKNFQMTLGSHANNPNVTKQDVLGSVAGLVQSGAFDGGVAQKLVANLPDDPQQLRMTLQQILKSQMTPEQIMTVFAPKPEKVDNGQQIGFRDTNPNSPTYGQATAGGVVQKVADPGAVLSAETARRGQNMTDARARELAEIQRSQPRGQFIETTNGYVLADPKTGAVRPVMGADGQPLKGKAADRQMTDAQAKANLFGSRMAESHRILNQLEGKYSPMAVNAKVAAGEAPMIGGVAGAVGNAMLSSEGQMAEQAQRDFINAVLRRESGAVINPNEFENAKKQYFPQPNDDQKTLAQKRRNRELAIRGMEAEVPGGFRGAPSLTSTGQTGGASGDWGNDPLGLRK